MKMKSKNVEMKSQKLPTFYTEVNSPIGKLLLTGDGESLTGVNFQGGTDSVIPEEDWIEDGKLLKVLVLTAKDSAETITLDTPIENDSTKDGRTVAWARSHRYASLQSLRWSKVTSDLQGV